LMSLAGRAVHIIFIIFLFGVPRWSSALHHFEFFFF
jgi:hypothetical protein